MVQRGRSMLQSVYGEDRKAGSIWLVLAAVITAAFLFATQRPLWTGAG